MELVITLISSFLGILLLGVGLVVQKRKPTSTNTPSTNTAQNSNTPSSLTTFSNTTKVSLAKDGKFIGHVFDAKNTKNMCTIQFNQSSAKPFTFTKDATGYYIIQTDCDGDGKFTSRLSDNATDLIQAGRMSTDVWKVACPSARQGCSIQAKNSKKYLAVNGLSTSPVYWTVANYT